ncbi:MAG: DUF1559 domain-containing protein [Planctomycetes bacterium]|nr:DUF1559 domain-containing protein [Planctomycetota bacterium]
MTPAPRRAFTLVELIVVIGIIGTLLALAVAGVQHVRTLAARTECANKLKQIGIALHHYHSVHRVFPPGCSYKDGADPYPHMSWLTRILPYIDQDDIWTEAKRAFAQDPFFLNDPPHTALSRMIPLYLCPSDYRMRSPALIADVKVGLTSYLGVEGTDLTTFDGVLYLDSRVKIAHIIDGTSTTLMVGERPPSADLVLGWWYAGWGQSKTGSGDYDLGVRELNVDIYGPGCPSGPYAFTAGDFANQCDAFHFWSPHSGGANFLFADGSVRFLSYGADPIMSALATRAGREIVPDQY